MTVEVTILTLTDSQGEVTTAVGGDVGSTFVLSGIPDGGVRQYFESESYHAAAWAAEHGFKLEIHTVKLDITGQELQSWKVAR